MQTKPFYLAGGWRDSDDALTVRSPYGGDVVAAVAVPTDADVAKAVASAATTMAESRKLPNHARADALAYISRQIGERHGELAELIAHEGGKPVKWAAAEVTRASYTFRWAAEEARRWGGEFSRLDTDAPLGSRAAIVRRFPYGPVFGIAPFNWPLNLVAHKMAPALAVGAPIVIKPASATPLGALALAELFDETDLPGGMLSVLPISGSRAEALVADARFGMVSFTGSTEVGWRLKALAPEKRFALELGGNAAVIVHDDADLDHAAARIALGGNYQAGQTCVSVQRVLVQASVYERFSRTLAKEVQSLKSGDPLDPTVDVGPLIDPEAVDRVAEWVDEAIAGGATALCGAERRDPFYTPTVLVDTQPEMSVVCREVFGPVIAVTPYQTFEEAIVQVNESRYGLHAGVFTRDIARAFLAHRDLEVGGVIVNDTSAFRADQMPYGGTKESGRGREGLRYAMEDMTEPRVLVLTDVPL
jgi:aldehyde dehydrogenase (NAD+)